MITLGPSFQLAYHLFLWFLRISFLVAVRFLNTNLLRWFNVFSRLLMLEICSDKLVLLGLIWQLIHRILILVRMYWKICLSWTLKQLLFGWLSGNFLFDYYSHCWLPLFILFHLALMLIEHKFLLSEDSKILKWVRHKIGILIRIKLLLRIRIRLGNNINHCLRVNFA